MPILLGYGKHSNKKNIGDDDDDDDEYYYYDDEGDRDTVAEREAREKYKKVRAEIMKRWDPAHAGESDAIQRWEDYFRHIINSGPNEHFNEYLTRWSKNEFDQRITELNSFIRQIALLLSPTENDFISNLERFRKEFQEFARPRIDKMYTLWGHKKQVGFEGSWEDTKQFNRIRYECKINLDDYLNGWRIIPSRDFLFKRAFLQFVLDFITLATDQPSDFESNVLRFIDLSERTTDKDVDNHFAETLEDTEFADDIDLHEPVIKKRRKEVRNEKELIRILFGDDIPPPDDIPPDQSPPDKKPPPDDDDDDDFED